MPSKGDTTKQDKGIKTCKRGVDEDGDGHGDGAGMVAGRGREGVGVCHRLIKCEDRTKAGSHL